MRHTGRTALRYYEFTGTGTGTGRA